MLILELLVDLLDRGLVLLYYMIEYVRKHAVFLGATKNFHGQLLFFLICLAQIADSGGIRFLRRWSRVAGRVRHFCLLFGLKRGRC